MIKLTFEEAKALLDQGTAVADVREENEYATGHVENSVNLPLSLLIDVPEAEGCSLAEEQFPDKSAPQMVYPMAVNLCREFDKLQMRIDDMNGIQSGIIRIGTFSSVATHWLPNIIAEFEKHYPNLEYELLLGDYEEIENWISERRVDFGFLRLPTRKEFETIPLAQDQQKVVLPKNHPLADAEVFPVKALSDAPFIMLEKSVKAEMTDIFVKNGLVPKPKYTTFDDYAVMSMVEKGPGISILPTLILKRHSYDIVIKPLDVPAFLTIGIAMKSRKELSLAAARFLDFLDYRESQI